MSRTPILIGAAFALALSASAAAAMPLAPPRAAPAPEAAPLAEPVYHRSVRRYGGHHPRVFFRRHHRPNFSFSLNFGAPVVRHSPYYQYYPYPYYTYTYPRYAPYYYTRPHHYGKSGRHFDRW